MLTSQGGYRDTVRECVGDTAQSPAHGNRSVLGIYIQQLRLQTTLSYPQCQIQRARETEVCNRFGSQTRADLNSTGGHTHLEQPPWNYSPSSPSPVTNHAFQTQVITESCQDPGGGVVGGGVKYPLKTGPDSAESLWACPRVNMASPLLTSTGFQGPSWKSPALGSQLRPKGHPARKEREARAAYCTPSPQAGSEAPLLLSRTSAGPHSLRARLS